MNFWRGRTIWQPLWLQWRFDLAFSSMCRVSEAVKSAERRLRCAVFVEYLPQCAPVGSRAALQPRVGWNVLKHWNKENGALVQRIRSQRRFLATSRNLNVCLCECFAATLNKNKLYDICISHELLSWIYFLNSFWMLHLLPDFLWIQSSQMEWTSHQRWGPLLSGCLDYWSSSSGVQWSSPGRPMREGGQAFSSFKNHSTTSSLTHPESQTFMSWPSLTLTHTWKSNEQRERDVLGM